MSDMICPRCGETLGGRRLHEVEMQLCPGCQGLLVEQPRLMSLLDAMAEELLEHMELDTEVKMVEDAGPVGACPNCGASMDCEGYMGAKDVFIDRCNSCWRIWIDPMELGAMSLIYARAENKLRYIENKPLKQVEYIENKDSGFGEKVDSTILHGGKELSDIYLDGLPNPISLALNPFGILISAILESVSRKVK